MSTVNSIVRLQRHENRTPTGKVSVTATRKLMQYLAYGRGGPEEQARRRQRGIWLDHNGQELTHEQAMAWAMSAGREQRFTRQLILSVREADLAPEAYQHALSQGEPFLGNWLLMRHTDAAHSHAHVLSFSDHPIQLKHPVDRDWWYAVHRGLENQRELALEAELSQDLQLQQTQVAARQVEQEWELDWGISL